MSHQEKDNRQLNKQHIVITDPITDRYETFGLISWWKQEIVRDATVMVVGAGALGNEVLKNLALMGIGNILIIDFDEVEGANLSRSILFRTSDNGEKKANVAARAVQEINPDVTAKALNADIRYDVGLGVYRRVDAIIGCLDNREARLAVNQACWHLNKPWVDGAIEELLGIARTFRPNDGACYECTLTDEDYRLLNFRLSCQLIAQQNIIDGKVPTTPTIASIIGGIQTQEALKLLHGMDINSGQALVFNGLNNEFFTVEYKEKKDCLSHWLYDNIVELQDASTHSMSLREMLAVARAELGYEVKLQIPNFVTKSLCSQCNIEVDLMKPRHLLTPENTYCIKCGQLMEIMTFDYVKGDETFIDFKLNEVGIPPLDVMVAVTPKWEFRYFELSGDVRVFF